MEKYDIAIIGAGISGFSAALRLQKRGFKTITLEAHGQIGGCSGFFTKKGFSFDVGATTLVDFTHEGIGGQFLNEIGLSLPQGEYLDYIAWLPDRKVTLFRDPLKWNEERLNKLGSTGQHKKFWKLMDKITEVFWTASRRNMKLPIQQFSDLKQAIRAIGFQNLIYARYLNYTMLDIIKKFKLENDKPLVGFLSMLIEDTVHSTLDKAPFINAALGTTIRGAGLMRAKGGMKEFWSKLETHYQILGGDLKKGNLVREIEQGENCWILTTNKGTFQAKEIISSLPVDSANKIYPGFIQEKIHPFAIKNEALSGGAIVVFLAVPESEVNNQPLTHHQLLQDYTSKLGNGNNMFISVSAKDDLLSAPEGYRSVMISTHCELPEWQNLSTEEYNSKKTAITDHLITCARRVYPNLGRNALIRETGTPLTYQKYTHRKNGMVGGFKQTLLNSNFKAIPHNIGIKNFWLTGDNTWPGLGTVAGLISGRIAAEYAMKNL